MKTIRPSIVISATAILLAGFDIFIKPVSAVALGLLIIAALPWALPYIRSSGLPIESIDLPWLSIRLSTLENLAKKAEAEDLLAEPKHRYSFEEIYDTDPILALAGLRIELERTIINLAEANNLYIQPQTIVKSMLVLRDNDIISEEQLHLMRNLLPELNKAVHARNVEQAVHHWVMQVGPKLLAGLEQRFPAK